MTGAHLLLETSGRAGWVALVRDGAVVSTARLDEARRHARDLAQKTKALLEAENLSPPQVAGVVISLGPGSYTGLRVGLASAKAFAFAIDCPLLAVPTFDAIANRTPSGCDRVHVIADGLQGLVFAQTFQSADGAWVAFNELRLMKAAEWVAILSADAAVTGPGLAVYGAGIPSGIRQLPAELHAPSPESLWQASQKCQPLSREEMFRIEPLYLRGSSAEEKRKAQSANAAMASARVS